MALSPVVANRTLSLAVCCTSSSSGIQYPVLHLGSRPSVERVYYAVPEGNGLWVLPRLPRACTKYAIPQDESEEIRRAASTGQTLSSLAEPYGTTNGTIRATIKRAEAQ
jgi:hypothetical protein